MMLAVTLVFLGSSALMAPSYSIRQRAGVASCSLADPSSEMRSLASPTEYQELLASAGADDITVIKWAADTCNTCRAAKPKIRSLLIKFRKKQPSAKFFSMDLKAAKDDSKDEMKAFFQSRNVTKMPFMEVYVGRELVQSLVVPPARVAFLGTALGNAAGRLRVARRRRIRRRLLLQMRSNSRERAAVKDRREELGRRWDKARAANSAAGPELRDIRRRHLRELRALASKSNQLRRLQKGMDRRRRLLALLLERS
jgi:hypothetical protein